MYYMKSLALAALAAVGVSAMPLGSRGLITADSLSRPVNGFIKRNSALDVTDDKKYFGRQILSSRDPEAAGLSSNPLHVSSPVGKNFKRVADDDDDGGLWADIADLFLPETQTGAAGDGKTPSPPSGTIIV